MGSRGKKILYWLIGVFAAILIILAFVPAILSTNAGTQFILNRISSNIPGKLTADNVNLSWFGSQEIYGLTLADPAGEPVVRVEKIVVDRAFFFLIWGSTDFGHVTITSPRLMLVVHENGTSNLQEAIARFYIPLMPQLAAVTPQLSFSANLPEGTLVIDDAVVTVTGTTRATLRSPRLLAAHPAKAGPLTVKGSGTIEHGEDHGSFDIDLEVEHFHNDRILDAFKTAHGHIRATKFPVVIADELLLQKGQLVQMVGETADLDVQIEPSRLSGSLITPLVDVVVNASPTEATIQATGQNLQIKPTRFTLEDQIRLDAPTQVVAVWQGAPITINLEKFEMPLGDWREGRAFFTASATNLQVQVDAKQLDQGTINGKAHVRDLPVDFEAVFAITKQGQMTLPRARVEVEGRYLQANFIARYTAKGEVEFLSPLHIHYDIFPEMLSRPEVLKKPFELETFVEVGTLPVEEMKPDNLQLSGTFTSTDIILADGSITNLKGDYSVDVPKNKAQFTARANSTAGKDSGKARIDATLSNFFQKGAFNWQTANANIDASLKPLPVAALMLAAGTPHRAAQIEALLGRRADLEASAKLKAMTGPASLSIDSQNTQAVVRGQLKNETLTLAAPLTASITITPEIGEYFLSDFNPLFVSAVRGENPVTLRIEPEGFAATRHIAGLQIGHASLDLGKLWVKNSGSIRDLLGLFRRSQLNERKEVLVWATPIYFSAKDGALTYQRADMVIGTSIQVAFWGTANLVNNNLRMTLAIPGYSLRKVLGLPDIPNTRYLIIPVGGTLDDSKIDYATAVPRIAALLARREGTAGQIVGALVETAVGTLAGQDQVPPPTTQPFPWANDPNYNFPAATAPSPDDQKPKEAIKKEVKKQAGKQLKKLLK